MKNYWKFGTLSAIIVLVLVGIAVSGTSGNQTYYKTIDELNQMGSKAMETRVRVGGDIAKGSILHKGEETDFTLVQKDENKPQQAPLILKVSYTGSDPLPDTFRDGAQALAEGKMGNDGVFHARKIQAKCASKYATKPGQAPPELQPPAPASTHQASSM